MACDGVLGANYKASLSVFRLERGHCWLGPRIESTSSMKGTARTQAADCTHYWLACILVVSLTLTQSCSGAPAWGPTDDLLSSPTPTAANVTSTASPTVSSVFFGSVGQLESLRGILAVVAILVGLGISAAGYRFFTPACFFCGFIAGGLLTARVVESALEDKSSIVALSWTSFVLGGLVAGGLAALIAAVGIIVAVIASSVLLAFIINAAVGERVYPSNSSQFLGILAVCFAILGGILVWSFEKPVLVSVTSLVGAGMVTWGVGRFAGHFPSGEQLAAFKDALDHESWLKALPGAWWGYLAGFIACFALGICCQYGKTSRHEHYQRNGRSVKMNVAASTSQHDTPYRDLMAAVQNQARLHSDRKKQSQRAKAGRSFQRPLTGFFV